MQSLLGSQVTGNLTAKSRACENCSRAKAKCIPQAEDMSAEQCARCFRLKKHCVIQPRAKRKKRSPPSGTTELEAKIESLVNLLTTQASKSGPVENSGRTASPPINHISDFTFDSQIDGFDKEPTPPHQGCSGASILPSRINAATTSLAINTGNYNTPESLQNTIVPVTKSSDELLHIFRTQYVVLFPYAVLLSHVTASDLADQQPWLYKMIMMVVSSHEHLKQLETAKLLLSELSMALLIRGERSLDMLQALLVYASWSHFYATVALHCQSSGIMQLVLALVYDLALNRAVRIDVETDKLLADVAKRKGERYVPGDAERSLAERRAFLYAFYLSSTFATCIRKSEGLQSSPYLEYNCVVMQEAADCESDLILVACVRFQSIADSINRALPSRLYNSDGRNAPFWMHVTQLQNELKSILNGLPIHLQNHTVVKMSYFSVDVLLLEAAVLDTIKIPTYHPRRIDLRWSCVMASKSLLDTFLAVPRFDYHTIPTPSICHVSFCLMSLFKVSFLEDPGWDLDHVRETIQLESYFDHLASSLEQVGASIDSSQSLPTRESFPTKCAQGFAWVKAWYCAKVGSEPGGGQSTAAQHPTDMMDGSHDMANFNTTDFMDELSWQEFMLELSYMPASHLVSREIF